MRSHLLPHEPRRLRHALGRGCGAGSGRGPPEAPSVNILDPQWSLYDAHRSTRDGSSHKFRVSDDPSFRLPQRGQGASAEWSVTLSPGESISATLPLIKRH